LANETRQSPPKELAQALGLPTTLIKEQQKEVASE